MEYFKKMQDIDQRNQLIIDRIKELEEHNAKLRQVHERIRNKVEWQKFYTIKTAFIPQTQ